jgi:PAS domain S-box-containing protein
MPVSVRASNHPAVTTTSAHGELERLRALVSDLDCVVWETDAASGRLTFVSEGAVRILGLAPGALLDDPALWGDRVEGEDRDAVLAEMSAGEPGRAHDLEFRFLHGDGSSVWLRSIGHTVADDDRPLVRGIWVDITRRKREELEETAELLAADELKNTFVAAVSHDLRTPLAAILGLAVTLEQQSLEEDEARDLAARIAANARRLDRMVSDLLDLDRLAHGVIEPSVWPVDVGDLVARVVRETEPIARRDVIVRCEEVIAEVDASKVERIVENLLVNAVRHTPPEARIWVSVRRHDDGVLLLVEDDGPGVPPELRPAIFEPFERGAASATTPGVGIGLALAARFAEIHDGRAWVEERDGGGASFRVWLPLNLRSAPPT